MNCTCHSPEKSQQSGSLQKVVIYTCEQEINKKFDFLKDEIFIDSP